MGTVMHVSIRLIVNWNPEISIPWDTLVALVALFEVGEDSSTKAVEDDEAAPTQYSFAAIQKRCLHCGKDNGESQYFVKINQILIVR